MPSALDRQLSNAEQDAFGHRHFAHALRSLIEADKHAPPFSIGLLGGWGTGKSTIKELYIRDLQDNAQKNEGGRTRANRIHSITFNAWRFGGKEQDIKRALLRHVFLELGGDEENLKDCLFRQISESREIPKKYREYTWELVKAWAMPIPAFLLSLILLYVMLYLILKLIPLQDDLSRAIIGIAFIGAYSYLLKQIKSPPVTAHRPITSITLPSTTAEQYEDLLLDQIDKFKSGESTTPSGKKGKFCERIVVFVDDLDRLSAEEMVQGLDAVRTFMEVPDNRLPKELGLVFVISCDELKVADALAKGRGQGDLPGTVFTQTDARRYLDRIFQFRLEIPPFPRHDMRQYAIKQINELPSIATDLHAQGVTVESVVDRMIHLGVHNPRNALQIVNAFAQAWWLARKRETEEIGTERPGGLHEGAVTKHPISLGAISAIRVNFPEFFRDLQNDPSLLHRMTDVLIRRKPLVDQPLSAQQIISEKYIKRRDESSSTPIEVRPEHRPLRQFLASLVGLRWPDSLQSLLLLSEDPITRKFGSKARTIYEAFVSGDSQGVLEGFGRHIDSSLLKADEAQLLYQMSEELRHESDTHRINASRVIADLVDRLPQTTTYQLIGSLCRELGDSADLRSQLGISKIKKIIFSAHADDQRAIASRLVEDVLTIEEDVRLRHETMEAPNLDEAVDFARSTLSLALPIRREHSLDSGADSQLLSWLVGRIVRVGGKSHQLPFQEFEHWMADHEDHLLPDIAHQYTDLVAAELEVDAPAKFNTDHSIVRVRKVFSSLWAAGQESRQTLWSNATRYVALNLPTASQAAWDVVVEHLTSPDSAQISKFIDAFVERLRMEANDEDWALDFDAATKALLSILRTRLIDLGESTLSKLSELAILWSQEDDDYAASSCDIANELKEVNDYSVFEDWAQRILNDLPFECIKLLGMQFSALSSATQAVVVNQLQPIINSDTIDELTGNRHRAFVASVPDAAWDADPLKEYLDKLLTQIAARFNNPNDYLVHVFPPIATVCHHASRNILGQSLQSLFSQAKNHPKHYARIHSNMVGHWLIPSDDLAPYNPLQIFREGCEFAVAQPSFSSKELLSSLRDMISRVIVPGEHRTNLINAACATWGAAPENAIDIFLSDFNDLTSDQTATLVDGIDLTKTESQALLSKAWSSIVKKQDLSSRIQTTILILAKGLNGPPEEPDNGLRLWIDALGENTNIVLADAITQSNLSDPNRRRLWNQIARIAPTLGSGFFLENIPKLVVLSPIDETAAALFAEYDMVSGVLSSTENRADLSQRLMGVFTNASTMTIKSNIAAWCKKLSGNAALKKLSEEGLSEDELSILNTHFPGATALKKIERGLKSQ